MYYFKLFFATLFFLLFIDLAWLGFFAKDLYRDGIGNLLRQSGGALQPNYYATILVYVLIAMGVLVFVLPNTNGNYVRAIGYGALFGFISYGIYDLTNYAILANWPLKITLIDMAWGTFLSAIVGLFATFVQNALQ